MYIESIYFTRPESQFFRERLVTVSIKVTNLNPQLNVIVGRNNTHKEVLSYAIWNLYKIIVANYNLEQNGYYEIIYVDSNLKYQYILKIEDYKIVLETNICLNDNTKCDMANFKAFIKTLRYQEFINYLTYHQIATPQTINSRMSYISHFLDLSSPIMWLDSVGFGLDFEERRIIGHKIHDKFTDTKSPTQAFIVTHEREILNAIPIEYYQILDGEQVYNIHNSKKAFEEHEFSGLNNFDLFACQAYKVC